ncbi:MAG: hypothetical protein ABI035_11665 [Gemmatimonadaceae bacterium]
MMAISALLERVLTRDTFAHLTNVQVEAMGAVKSLNPIQIAHRYMCAMDRSVAEMNREFRATNRDPTRAFMGEVPDSTDCAYRLSEAVGSQPAGAPVGDSPDASSGLLPAPVVGHWADGGGSSLSTLPIALMDTAWHLTVQPSFFGTVFALMTFAIAAMVMLLLMAWSFTPQPSLMATPGGLMLYAVGTIALSCVVALCLQGLMEGGLYAFGRITNIAGLCVGSAGITSFGFSFFTKAADVKLHDVVESIVPH